MAHDLVISSLSVLQRTGTAHSCGRERAACRTSHR